MNRDGRRAAATARRISGGVAELFEPAKADERAMRYDIPHPKRQFLGARAKIDASSEAKREPIRSSLTPKPNAAGA